MSDPTVLTPYADLHGADMLLPPQENGGHHSEG